MDIKYKKGVIFLDKNNNNLYIFDGSKWWEIVPTSYLKQT
jgi:hypothetical protein